MTMRAGGPVRPHRGPVGDRSAPVARGKRAGTEPRPDAVSGSLSSWSSTVARLLLGLVLAWFGYHELVAPRQWTGYVPVLSPTSSLAQVLVLAHGWVLVVLAVALVAGIAPRVAAGLSAVLLTEIVLWLVVSGGLSDLVLRDVGVLGLSVALVGADRQRLVLRR
jgi:uncharacterized membrane protein YphA (DoxX/SURF4 family)